jgi:hypothetical protein
MDELALGQVVPECFRFPPQIINHTVYPHSSITATRVVPRPSSGSTLSYAWYSSWSPNLSLGLLQSTEPECRTAWVVGSSEARGLPLQHLCEPDSSGLMCMQPNRRVVCYPQLLHTEQQDVINEYCATLRFLLHLQLILTLQSPVVIICTSCFNTLKLCILSTECFFMVLTVNSSFFPKQY